MNSPLPGRLTDPTFWNDAWSERGLPDPVLPHSTRSRDLFFREFHRKMALLSAGLGPDRSMIEIGCGSSAWLPYFAQELGFKVEGLDYSPIGCEQTRAVLAREKVEGQVYQEDLFSPPDELRGRHDLGFSFGVVEHFEDPERCLEAIAALVRPGGLIVTVVPNMAGSLGTIQSWVNRPVYELHVPHTAETLAAAHRKAGLEVIESDYFFSMHYGWVIENGAPLTPAQRVRLKALAALRWGCRICWWMEHHTAPLPASALLSPAIIAVARKPASPSSKA